MGYVVPPTGRANRIRAVRDALNFAWDTGTWFSRGRAQRLLEGTINGRCLDISKTTVDRVWGEVAGYSIAIDPLSFIQASS